jgi:RNA polymerase sigma-70 factor (ECF subfamily)
VRSLTDSEIIDLYLKRSENAINETAKQYGSYCQAIAMNILHNKEDSEEVVNDTYMSLWNQIPPELPKIFSAYIGKITRNLSLKKYQTRKAQKRGGDESVLLFSELDMCIPSDCSVENEIDSRNLAQEIDNFLNSIKKNDRNYFVNRYWYAESIPQIAKRFNISESKVKMSLHRTRKKLKIHLEKRGFST